MIMARSLYKVKTLHVVLFFNTFRKVTVTEKSTRLADWWRTRLDTQTVLLCSSSGPGVSHGPPLASPMLLVSRWGQNNVSLLEIRRRSNNLKHFRFLGHNLLTNTNGNQRAMTTRWWFMTYLLWKTPFKYSADLRISQHVHWFAYFYLQSLKFSLLFNKIWRL